VSIERWIRRWWRGEAGSWGRLLLAPALGLAGLFGLLVRMRNALYDRGVLPAAVAPIPVLGVGNLTVGGTGKTPVSAWLVRRLSEAGARPALVARGYGRDELTLHARWNPGVPVVASKRRPEAVREAAAQGATIAVLDDGFQHRRLARDADVVLLAAETPFPGRLLPAGPYREPARALARATLAVVTRKAAPEARAVTLAEDVSARFPELPVARAVLQAAEWQHLDGTAAPPPSGPILIATGVADPESVVVAVRAALAAAGPPGAPVPEPALWAFPDHHEFRERDALALTSRLDEGTLVVTEKDAVKLVRFRGHLPRVRVLALELRWETGEDAVEALLARCLEMGR
jgi:tetraacyldisaccharide 4'-kinase